MGKRLVVFLVAMLFLVSLGGCATARKQKDLDIQGLKNQVSVLEAQIQAKDEEINSLKDALNKPAEEKESSVNQVGKKRVVGEVKSRPSVKMIQVALKNAGFDPGHIDGRMGRQTRDAIKAFQKANNLNADGKTGKETWGLLGKYLYQKSK
ncbi:MAG: peptidoglycan-binding domain-containing protein [Candidatus Omnitrophica bacterium]|nr:peptidoglycan-binding domain-containing protein [Candidatus Omnitrophota bacterium]